MNKVVRKLVGKKDVRIFCKWNITSNFSTVSSYDVPVAKNLLKDNEILDSESIMRNIEQDYKNINAKVAVNAVNTLYENFKKSKKLDPKIVTNSEAFENICKVILKDIKSLSRYDTINILRVLLFFNVPTDKKCLKDVNILERCSIDDIDTFIKGFIIADYMPNNWETVSRMLQNFMINLDCSIHSTVFTVFRLLSLNSYHSELIEKAFTLYNKSFYEKNSVLFGKDITSIILRLYWCVKLLYPEYKGFMPDENKLNQIKMEHECYEVPYLMNSLKEVVGGTEYMKSGLKTKFGEFVDYVVVIQPDGSFMNTNNYDNITFVEELVSLSECSKILFFAFPIEAYSINKRNLPSTIKIQLKAIETLPGFHSFVINPYLWSKFSNKERILHIQNII
ncbi:hypothetical protein WN51_04818 [Melipona quadrifasciata]|uniref:RAP domain-containing protein n=1 Tax=Melipona quadrifasciata TaxID=166423 RepID=A0A0M8ZST9_9HYME|nr:hypothetical protein WN51_04818 [Melipona quadrifasciata]